MRKLIPVVRLAGAEILKIYAKEDFGVELKADDSPVTLADKAANKIITAELARLYPDIPILSEESKLVEYQERKNWQKCFIVDPIDGTKEFIKRNGQFTVNIALWERGKIIAGIIYAPTSNTLYFAQDNQAFRIHEGKEEKLPCEQTEKFTVVASNSHLNEQTKQEIEKIEKGQGEIEILRIGSSLKMCRLAEGAADYYPRLGPTSEWDTAAAQAILEASGCEIVEWDSEKPLEYNKENIINPHFKVRRKNA